MKTAKPIRLGIIGTGRIVERAHLPNFAQDKRIEVLSIAGRNAARTKELSQKFQIPNCFFRWNSMLKSKSFPLDAVSIATPNALHAPMTIEALKTGHHVLVEKPMAITREEAEEISQLAKETNKFALAQQTLRFNGVIKKIKELLSQNAIGDLKAISIKHGHPGPGSDWYRNKELAGGGVLFDLGIHAVDTLRWLVKTKTQWEVVRSTMSMYAEDQVETEANFHIKLSRKLTASVEVSWETYPPIGQIMIIGDSGIITSVYWPEKDQYLSLQEKNGSRMDISLRRIEPSSNTFLHFADVISKKESPFCCIKDNIGSLNLIFDAYESATQITRS